VEHTRRLYDEYGGVKECIEIGGDHNTSRGHKISAMAVEFRKKSLKRPKRRVTSTVPLPSDVLSEREQLTSFLPMHLNRWTSLPPPPLQTNQSSKQPPRPGSSRTASETRASAPSMHIGDEHPMAPIEVDGDEIMRSMRKLEKQRRHSCPPRELPEPPDMDGVTPRTVAPRGLGTRNPSPWEPNFVYEDRYAHETVPSEKVVSGLRQDDVDEQENVPPVMNSMICDKGRPHTHISWSGAVFPAQRSSATKDCKEEAPLCRTPFAAALPPAQQGAHEKKTSTVAEDPTIKPVPSSMQPLLLTSSCPVEDAVASLSNMRALAVVESDVIKDGCWCQPRHCLRHESTVGSPDNKHDTPVARSRQRASSFPWLCCGFTPGT
jgi:hypothetical protein